MDRVFSNGPGDLGSILGHVMPKTLKNGVNWNIPGKRKENNKH